MKVKITESRSWGRLLIKQVVLEEEYRLKEERQNFSRWGEAGKPVSSHVFTFLEAGIDTRQKFRRRVRQGDDC